MEEKDIQDGTGKLRTRALGPLTYQVSARAAIFFRKLHLIALTYYFCSINLIVSSIHATFSLMIDVHISFRWLRLLFFLIRTLVNCSCKPNIIACENFTIY